MIRSYFDISDILTNEETVPVTFLVPSFSLGRDIHARSSEGEALAEVRAGSVATVPLWAAVALHREGFLVPHVPPRYTTSVFREFKTDPLAVSLYAKSPYYYEAGLLLCAMLPVNDGNRLAAQLFRLYQLRYLKVIHAAAKKGFDLSDVREKLCESERDLLDALLRGLEDERQWHRSVL
ncbi:GINS complex subunit 3 [Trypanosoma rangeli]|uniref:GINS complex subunit 3 n=1 Tax=Trypanosoma rangeli TaxID=5698 RepID=A0A422MYQ9_TRYRA|nr:GINS complex subunit 3 [Trypanosoma rangeli]RNE98311.1 GINS complex subunit 3 [Trypanosoma rangeli]|eukprot:RNE98311.1 GINS complex subunit 3 [Trypanosoma rangeli]